MPPTNVFVGYFCFSTQVGAAALPGADELRVAGRFRNAVRGAGLAEKPGKAAAAHGGGGRRRHVGCVYCYIYFQIA